MKKLSIISMLTILSLTMWLSPGFAQDLPNFSARVHVQDIGWSDVNSDENHHIILGTMGQAKRIEAFEITVDYPDLGIAYDAHVQDQGWQGEKNGPQMAGTQGQAKQIEGMWFRLTGANADKFNIFYRAHVQDYGWLDWAYNGALCGTTNHFFRCEAAEIVIYPKNDPAPGRTITPIIQATTRQESRHIYLVNKFRREHNLGYVSGNASLKRIADFRLTELPVNATHTRPNGRSYETCAKDVNPNMQGEGGGFIESFIYGRTSFSEPEPAFDCYMAYPHMMDTMLDPSIRYMAWSGRVSGSMGYCIELFSGLDSIDF